jgi:quercetin dioxygenase-like cupin family protein
MTNHGYEHQWEHGPALPGRRMALKTGAGLIAAPLLAHAATAANAAQAAAGPVGHRQERARRTTMEIKRAGSQPSGPGPADWFTGTVRIDPLFSASAPARAAGAAVTFEPGARTAWHTHPLGQTLIVTAGVGRAQREGGPIEEIRPGDVVWFEPGEKHWHGASPTTAMTHIAVQEALDGKAVEWMEKVSDEQYDAGSRARTVERANHPGR